MPVDTVREIYVECIVLKSSASGVPDVLLVKSHADKWVFPKSYIAEGEHLMECALRALKEKEIVGILFRGKIEDRTYWYSNKTRSGDLVRILKKIYFYLFEQASSSCDAGRPLSKGAWFTPEEAYSKLSNEGEKRALQNGILLFGSKKESL